MKTFARTLLLAGLVAASASAFANSIALSDFSGSESVIDFGALGGTPATGPFTLDGATFSESSTGSGQAGWRYFGPGVSGNTDAMLGDNAGTSHFTINFATSYDRVGFYVAVGDATYDVDFYDGATLLGTSTVNVAGLSSQFVGFQNTAGGVTSAVIREVSGDNGRIGGLWDVHYENAVSSVPEPTSMSLMALALGGFAVLRRRRA